MQPAKTTPVPPLLLLLLLAFVVAAFSGCVTKRKIYDSQGRLVDEQTIVKRPVKDFVDSVEFE